MDKRFIDQCELEQLHESGAIQAHGCLLICNQDGRLVSRSLNWPDLLGPLTELALGQPLPHSLAHLITGLPEATGSRQEHLAGVDGRQGLLDVACSRNASGQIVLEFFPTADGDPDTSRLPHNNLRPPRNSRELQTLRQDLVNAIAELSGFHRVMYYRFREDDDGEVINETRNSRAYGSYLGLRFPASDIPMIARVLYLINPWRLISNVNQPTVPLESLEAQKPDLSYSDLRSVSPIHTLYLNNMKVEASLSFPIISGNELRGLIACHHRAPRHLGLPLLNAINQEVRAHNMAISSFHAQRRIQMLDSLSLRFDSARDIVFQAGDLISAWPRLGAWLCNEFGADGAVLYMDRQYASMGLALEESALQVVDHWVSGLRNEMVWMSDHLCKHVPGFPLSMIAGLLAIRFKRHNGDWLRVYLCRQEHIHEIAWGGNPDKPIEVHDGKFGIAPRQSFEKWLEKRIGHSRPWDNEERLLGLKLRELLLQVS